MRVRRESPPLPLHVEDGPQSADAPAGVGAEREFSRWGARDGASVHASVMVARGHERHLSRVRAFASFVLVAALASGVVAPADAQRATLGAVSGVVRDSASRMPLPGALVQLSDAGPRQAFARAARTDSLGRFRVDSVPAGRYSLGFLHARLDSLGVQASVRVISVRAGRATRADLVTPSARLLRETYCGPSRARGALVMGVVRRASDGSVVTNGAVVGEWLEFVMRGTRLERQQPALAARTGDDGGYVLCDVPARGSVFVSASIGSDTTDRIELVADRSGVMRRDLFVGPVRTLVQLDTTAVDDTLRRAPLRLRSGDATLRGRVGTADGDRPLPGASVRITDGPHARANARGEWVLTGVPAGTRVLEVRAIGFYPQQIPVDVVTGALPVRVALWTFQSLLDTVRVNAAALGDRSGGGFAARARSAGSGTFLDSTGIRRRGGVSTSDVFRSLNGVRVDGAGIERTLLVRGAFGYCVPAVFLDGLYMPVAYVDDLDIMAPRDRISGIEVYAGHAVPAEFQRTLSGCGAIVIWTRPARAAPRRD